MAAAIDRFGPFTIDRDRRRLTADGRPLILSDRHFDVLLALTSQPGVVLSKEHLIETAWHGVAVGDDSLYRAIRDLRDTLGPMSDGQPHIETHSRRGFRFAARIEHASPSNTRTAPPVMAADTGAIVRFLEPHMGFIDGRTALETLDANEIARAREVFTRALEPGEWRHHLRLAFVAGGGERLRAAQRVLELRPGFALAHWMAATVLVGRQALAAARGHLRLGCDAQDTQSSANAGFTAVGLHLVHGLVLAAAGEID